MLKLSVAVVSLLLGLFAAQAAGRSAPVSLRKTVQFDDFTLDCTPAAKFTGKDSQSKCFGRCDKSNCLAAIYNKAGPPSRQTCAIIPLGANCKPSRSGAHNIELNVPSVDYSYRTSHSLDRKKEKELFSQPGIGLEQCKEFCSLTKGCNAVRSSPMTCQLLQLTGKQKAVSNGRPKGRGDGPLCHNSEWVYYADKSLAPAEKGCEVMTD